jgi:hypothetical protein
MIHRRSFLRSLLLAAVAPNILVPVLKDRQNWIKTWSVLWTPNPEWLTAPYELRLPRLLYGRWMFEVEPPLQLTANEIRLFVEKRL